MNLSDFMMHEHVKMTRQQPFKPKNNPYRSCLFSFSFVAQLGYDHLKPTVDFHTFTMNKDIVSKKECGYITSVVKADTENYTNTALLSLVVRYKPVDIYNIDEMTHFISSCQIEHTL